MTFIPVTPITQTSSHSRSDYHSDDKFVLSQSLLFPDYIASLDDVSRTLQQLISVIDGHKSHLDGTYQRYIKYRQNTEEQRLSWQIFNSHICHFQKSFIKLLIYINNEEWMNLSGEIETYTPCNWVKLPKLTSTSDAGVCKRLLQYNPVGSLSNAISDYDLVNSSCVEELGDLARKVSTISKTIARKYWNEKVEKLISKRG
jgi:hypothetical protein